MDYKQIQNYNKHLIACIVTNIIIFFLNMYVFSLTSDYGGSLTNIVFNYCAIMQIFVNIVKMDNLINDGNVKNIQLQVNRHIFIVLFSMVMLIGIINSVHPTNKLIELVMVCTVFLNVINLVIFLRIDNEYSTIKIQYYTDDEQNTDCAMCLSDFVVGDLIKKLSCDHVYHASCIDSWLQNATICPKCGFIVINPIMPYPSNDIYFNIFDYL